MGFSRNLRLRLGAFVLLKSKVLRFSLSVFLFLALSAHGVANSVQLVLHERVDVTNSLIRLGDVVAQIEGRLEPKQLSALKTLKLKPAPLPGRAGIEITARSLGIYLRVGRSGLKDSILAGDVVESMPKILNGNAILITVQINGVSVRTTGKALADGRVGDKIKVVNQASRKTVIGTVTEDGEIAVNPQ